MVVKAGGSVIINEKEVGTLSADGILLGRDSKEIARLKPDGMVVAKDGNSLGKVHPKGDLEFAAGLKCSWVKGNLKIGVSGSTLRLDPDKDECKRWASFLLLLNFTAEP